MLLAIETSCDETAAALIDISRPTDAYDRCEDFLLAHLVRSQVELHQPYGGVVPELAAREHLAALPVLVGQLLRDAGVALNDVSAVAATSGPGLKGCLLVGMAYARGIAFSRRLPFLPVNHLEGHLCSGDLAVRDERPELPMLALLVSGGHTELHRVAAPRSYELISRTLDDAVGEAFDKCATVLRLPYPGGPALSKLAESGTAGCYELPRGVDDDDASFSFSGVKTAVFRLHASLGERVTADPQCRADLAAAIEETLVDSLITKTERAIERHPVRTLLVCGGVAANRRLRQRAQEAAVRWGVRLVVPELRWCSDNAAMIGVAASRRIHLAPGGLASFPHDSSAVCPARARWPLEQLDAA